MASMDIQKANILSKIQFLNQYFSKIETQKADEDEAVNLDEINEDAFTELSLNFEETFDTELLDDAVDTLYSVMDVDKNNEISNSELLKFKDIFEKVGLTVGEVLALYNEFEKEISNDVDVVEAKSFEDIDIDTFKEMISNYPKLQEIIEEIGYDKFFDIIDTNKNGIFDSDEIAKISGFDENEADFSYSDLQNIIDENGIEVTDFREKVAKEFEAMKSADEGDSKNSENISSSAQKSSYPASNYNAGSSSGVSYAAPSSSASTSYSSSVGSSSSAVSASVDTIESLEEQKAEKQSELDTLNSKLSNIYDDSDEQIAKAKADMDSAQAQYEELLATEAKNNPQVELLMNQQKNNQLSIDKNNKEIEDYDAKLTQTNEDIALKNSEINYLNSELTALQNSLEAAQAVEITERNEAEVEAKIAELNSAIEAKCDEISAAQDELDGLEDDKTTYEDKISNAKELDKSLRTERDRIENAIAAQVSEETKNALKNYQSLRTQYETTKETAISDTKAQISEVQNSIVELEEKISELQAEKIEKENQISPWGNYDAQRGQALAQAAESLYGGVTQGSGSCALGVSEAFDLAFGTPTSGHGYQYGETMSNMEGWAEVTDSIHGAEDLNDLPAGAVVSWSPYNSSGLGSTYGHVYITDGQGHGISDFKEDISSAYFDKGGTCRVFIPV